MFRSVLSVFLGAVLMMMLTMTFLMGMIMFLPNLFLNIDVDILASDLILSFGDVLIAIFCGYFTVAIAGKPRIVHAKALVGLVLLMSLVNLPNILAYKAHWYIGFRFCAVPVCVYLGGWLRCKQYPQPFTQDKANA